jgi:hypothetical protein
MSTPLLDNEILKLRRRLGDIFNEDGTAITTSNVYLSTSGTTFPQLELIDIYNDAIRSFMVYLTKAFPTHKWWEYLPGYIVFLQNQTVTSGKLLLSAITPTLFQLMDMAKYSAGTPVPAELSNYISADQWLATKNGLIKTRKPDATHIFYTVMADGSITADASVFLTTAITVINSTSKTITRTGGVFSVGSLINCTIVTAATGAIVSQWTGRIVTGGASATYQVIDGTDSTLALATQTCSVIVNGTHSVNPSTLYVLPTSITAIDMIYLKDHTDFIQNHATIDLNGISQDALRRILIFAEVEARKWKSTEAADVPESQLQNMIAQDMASKG